MSFSRSRFRGALLGLAAGDALGTTLEFRSPGSFAPLADMVGGGPFRLEAGQWTDDTSMALCLAESVIEKGKFDPMDQLERYCQWWKHGHLSAIGRCFDIGNTTRSALATFLDKRSEYPGPTGTHSAGNGSIMRLAPVPMRWAYDPTTAIRLASQSSRTTHGATECLDACRLLAALIVMALDGADKDAIVNCDSDALIRECLSKPLASKVAAIAAGSFKWKSPPQIVGSGYVVQSLEAALWAFFHSMDFREGALLAVNLGDDADTTGAVYGQLAGAYYGEDGIPADWRIKLAMRETIEGFSDQLHDAALRGSELPAN